MTRQLSRGQPKGQKHARAKLSEDDVKTILKRLSQGEKQQVLADEYEVSRSNISRIKTGDTWSHLGGTEIPARVGSDRGSSKLTEDDVKLILDRIERGESLSAVARAFQVGRTTVADIWHGRRWKHIPRKTSTRRRKVYDGLYKG